MKAKIKEHIDELEKIIESIKNLTDNERTIKYLDNDIKSLKTSERLIYKSIEFIEKGKTNEN